MTLRELLAINTALVGAASEIARCHAELDRLRDVEMIPIQHQPTSMVANAIQAASVITGKAIDEMSKGSAT